MISFKKIVYELLKFYLQKRKKRKLLPAYFAFRKEIEKVKSNEGYFSLFSKD